MQSQVKRDYDDIFKLLLLGDSGVGKSCLLMRFSDDSFADSYCSTIGVDFRLRSINLDDKRIKLQIWDTAGQERFATISSSYYRGVDGIMIVYDIGDKSTLDRVSNHWLNELNRFPETQLSVKLLVGNKLDVGDEARQVSFEQGSEFAKQNGFQFVETSAKNTINVESAFMQIARMVSENKEKNGVNKLIKDSKKKPQPDIDLNNNNNKKESCMCRLF